MKTLRDNLWLWGQTPNSHHACERYHLPGENKMDSAEGCEFFGIPNVCRVAMSKGPFPPFDDETRKIAHLKQIVWSIIGAGGVHRNEEAYGDLEEVVRQAQMFPNVTGAVLDDFLRERRRELFSPAKVREMREKLISGAGRPMDLWVVWYDREINAPVKPYLDECDVITYWTWYGYNFPKLENYLDHMISVTPGKRRLAGCYMWNYGEGKPLTDGQMEYQLEVYLKYIQQGKLEGLVLCSNCIADIGLSAVDIMKRWIDKNGDLVIG